MRRNSGLFEALEQRFLLSVTIELDYSLDTQGFFSNPNRRAVMDFVADYMSDLLLDDFAAITPSGPNTWTAMITSPGEGTPTNLFDLTIPADTIRVYVGGRDLGPTTLGVGGAGGYSASGSQVFLDSIEGRGQPGAIGPDASKTDYGLWGGAITFNTTKNWYAGITDDGLISQNDLLSVAFHEMVHVLGFTIGVPSFANLLAGTEFMGPRVMAESDSGSVFVGAGDMSHWASGTTDNGQETAMDPTLTVGTRKLLTRLDLAALDDIGWELAPVQWGGAGPTVSWQGVVATGASTLSLPGRHSFNPFSSAVIGVRVEADAPVSVRLWDSAGRIVNEQTMPSRSVALTFTGAILTETYHIEVYGAAATYDLAVVSESGSSEIYYPEGFASTQTDEIVWITNPSDDAEIFTLQLRYEDASLARDGNVLASSRVLMPGERIGIDIARDGVFATDVLTSQMILPNQPFAVVLTSTHAFGATMVHADEFGAQRISTGEDFTDETGRTWHFARVQKSASVFDFMVYYNPNDHDAVVTITAFTGGGQVQIIQTIGARRRGGLNLMDTAALPMGAYGVEITSAAVLPANDPSHVGIVAALTHFDAGDGTGWGALGAPGASTSGLIPMPRIVAGATGEISIFNPGTVEARVRLALETSGGRASLGEHVLAAGEADLITTGADFSAVVYEFVAGSGAVQLVQRSSLGEAISARALDAAYATHAFGLADFDSSAAGLSSFSLLGLYNAGVMDANVTIRFSFLTGADVITSVMLSAGSTRVVEVSGLASVLARLADGPFSVTLTSDRAIVASLSSFDVLTGEGFASTGRGSGSSSAVSVTV